MLPVNSDLSSSRPSVPATPPTSKDQILDAAQKLLACNGYAGLSMRELAAKSGVAKATIYHHFQDKDALFYATLERDMARVHERLVTAANQETGAVAKISAVIRVYVSLMRERRTVLISVLHELSRKAGDLCTFIYERRSHYFTTIGTILEEGVADGTFRPLNVEQTSLALIGMINAYMIFSSHEEALDDESATAKDEQFVEHTIALFLKGVQTHGS